MSLLRASACTVDELATQLELTDNAVRAHLLTLERDGLVRQSGLRRGPRKPHYTYALTSETDSLFPKAYDALLNQLIAILKNRMEPREIEEVLREVGRYVASGTSSEKAGDLEGRVQVALKVLAAIGGAAEVEQRHDGKVVIRSSGCPLAAALRQPSDARHHPPPGAFDLHERRRVGGLARAVVRRADARSVAPLFTCSN